MPVLSNAKHERFAQEIAKGVTAEEAYKLAGYSPSLKNAQRLKSNEGIRSRVEEILSQAAKKAGISVERILDEYAKIAFADITEAVDWGDAITIKNTETGEITIGNGIAIIAAKDLPKHIRGAIAEVKQTKEGIAIKFHSKTAALEALGKHLGMFKERIEHSGSLAMMITPEDAEL
jgi:phage terminase small subunit